MSIIVPNQAEKNILKLLLKLIPGEPGDINYDDDLYINLYNDDITLSEDTTLINFEDVKVDPDLFDEAEDPNQRILTKDEWSLTTGGDGIAIADEKTLKLKGGGVGNDEPYIVYGYYITKGPSKDHENNILLWAERFPGNGFNVGGTGAEIKLTLRLEVD